MLIDTILQQQLQAYLNNQERLLWVDKPGTGIQFSKADWFLIPFGLFFTGFAIFWILMAINLSGGDSTVNFSFFGIPFVLFGFYILFGRHLLDARKRTRSIYAITSERALILHQGSGTLHSYPLEQLRDVTYTQGPDGRGNLYLGALDPRFQILQGTSWPGVKHPPTFQKIRQIQHVYALLTEARSKLLSSGM